MSGEGRRNAAKKADFKMYFRSCYEMNIEAELESRRERLAALRSKRAKSQLTGPVGLDPKLEEVGKADEGNEKTNTLAQVAEGLQSVVAEGEGMTLVEGEAKADDSIKENPTERMSSVLPNSAYGQSHSSSVMLGFKQDMAALLSRAQSDTDRAIHRFNQQQVAMP